MALHARFCVGEGELVLANPLPWCRLEREQRRGVVDTRVVFVGWQPALGEKLPHLDARLCVEIANEQDSRVARAGFAIELLCGQGHFVLAAAVVTHYCYHLEAGGERALAHAAHDGEECFWRQCDRPGETHVSGAREGVACHRIGEDRIRSEE